MLVKSVKCRHSKTTLNFLIHMVLNNNLFIGRARIWNIFLTTWQVNNPLRYFVLQRSIGSHLYSGTSTQAHIFGAWLKLLLCIYFFFSCCLCLLCYSCFVVLCVSNDFLHNNWHCDIHISSLE